MALGAHWDRKRRSVVRIDASAILFIVFLLADGEVFAAIGRTAAVIAVPTIYAYLSR